MRIETIIQEEGLADPRLLPGILKGNRYLNASEYLFRFILSDDDPRWAIAAGYTKAKQANRFKPVSFESALSAIYLSDRPSFRGGYGMYNSPPTLRQLCRAVINIGCYPELKAVFDKTSNASGLPEGLSWEFARTERILSGTDRRGITGCPEALYQVRVFCQGTETSCQGKYLGRVGFNIHTEGESQVMSVTNLQGIPCGPDCYHCFTQRFGIKFFNALVNQAKRMAAEHPIPIQLKGLKNPNCIGSSGLYNATFKTEGIQRVSFKRL
ncbi:hypothetical protein HYU95_03460 [Candidatus Daviesbacteria bacterium]|nr:hypothetical protein [Candidatus Daviesbacteria bacterium]